MGRLLGIFLFSIMTAAMVMADVSQRSAPSADVATKVQTALRQLSAERDALIQENARLKEQLQQQLTGREAKILELNRKLESMQKRTGTVGQSLAKYQEANETLRERLSQSVDRIQKIVAKYKELVDVLRQLEQERAHLADNAYEQAVQVNQCTEKNQRLYMLNIELLNRYKKKGVWAALLQKEPFTQLQRVEIENITLEYQQKFDEYRVGLE